MSKSCSYCSSTCVAEGLLFVYTLFPLKSMNVIGLCSYYTLGKITC